MLKVNMSAAAVRDQRGLFYQHTLYESIGTSLIAAVALSGQDLKPGVPTPIAVPIDLPANANVNSITADLVVVDLGESSSKQNVGVNVTQGTTVTDYGLKVDVKVASNPQNLEIRLDGGDVLFSRAGILPPGTYEIPDFAQHVNAFLDRATARDGQVTLQFLVKSDTEGRVRLTIKSSDYSLLQTQAWTNELDGTFRVDRNLQLTFRQESPLELDAIPLPSGRTLRRQALRLDVTGDFGPERLLGPAEQHDGAEFLLVNADRSCAQCFRLSREVLKDKVLAAGIAGYFETSASAELYLELQPDAGGVPAAGPPLGKANVAVEPPSGAERPWTFAPFEQQVELDTDRSYWIVAKAAQGVLHLGVRRIANADSVFVRERVATHRGGQLWKDVTLRRYTAVAPREVIAVGCLLALAYVPDPDTQMAAIELVVPGGAEPVKTDPGATVATVTVPLSGGEGPRLELLIRSNAAGSLTVANVVQEYQVS